MPILTVLLSPQAYDVVILVGTVIFLAPIFVFTVAWREGCVLMVEAVSKAVNL